MRWSTLATTLVAVAGVASGEEVTLAGGEPGVTLAAELQRPGRTAGCAVLMLPVAGPTDRDMSLGPRGIHAALAERLAQAGVVSLRIGARGLDGSSGDWLLTDLETRVGDARAALEWLRRNQRGVPIGALGMSEGGAIALRLAAEGRVDFVVALSTPVHDGAGTLRRQRDRLLDASALPPEHRKIVRQESDRFLEALLRDDREAVARVLSGPAGHLILPPYSFVPRDAEGRLRFALSPWYRSQVGFTLGDTLERLRAPLYAAYGALDQVVDPQTALAELEATLGDTDARLEMFDGLNHLMMPAVTGSPLEYGRLPELLSEELWSSVISWLGSLGLLPAEEDLPGAG